MQLVMGLPRLQTRPGNARFRCKRSAPTLDYAARACWREGSVLGGAGAAASAPLLQLGSSLTACVGERMVAGWLIASSAGQLKEAH